MRVDYCRGNITMSFISANEDVSAVICAPAYGHVLGLGTEVVVGPE